MKKKWGRIAGFVCAMLMLVSLLVPEQTPMVPTAQAVTQSEIDKLKDEAKELAKQQSETKYLRITSARNLLCRALPTISR